MAEWDPDKVETSKAPSKDAIARMTRDLQEACTSPLPGILVIPGPDVRLCQAVVVGPEGTPYEGSPLLFKILFPADYPFSPPAVKLLTTGGGLVRFGPNLYANGKVCLSILGTWAGPQWMACHTLSTVLLSIQSLLHANAARNEPGQEQCPLAEVKGLNDVLLHECLRVACLGQMRAARGQGTFSQDVREALLEHFLAWGDALADKAAAAAPALDGTPFTDPPYAKVLEGGGGSSLLAMLGGSSSASRHTFRFAELAKLLTEEAALLLEESGEGEGGGGAGGGSSSSSSSSSSSAQ